MLTGFLVETEVNPGVDAAHRLFVSRLPEAIELVNHIRLTAGLAPCRLHRNIVRPGISGWAQVNQGYVESDDDEVEKLYFGFYYIKNFSLWLDALIVVKRVKTIFSGFGAR